ncbi:MAG: GDP-mannose 4,6-dehydratase [Desulfamplus sp.]|nr:GDP-mannose 4,6-dehydratase [Desulfamplus sp.]
MSNKHALICGISGQDGAYLAKLLLEKGYEVTGTSRDAMANSFKNLRQLGIFDQVRTVSMSLIDFGSVVTTIKSVAPDEIYSLAGQTSVGLSFEQPVETMESISMGTLHLLEAIRFLERPIRYYSAGTSECFGDIGDLSATEETSFKPQSPYAVAKVSAHHLVSNYRNAYGLFVCTGILFNHESSLRPERFVTQKIVRTAARIANGSGETLRLGNMDIFRDWGWAPEYVKAMWLMLQQNNPEDFIIATGKTVSLSHFVSRAFAYFGLDWNKYVVSDPALCRPSDIRVGRGNPARAKAILGWEAQTDVDAVVDLMCEAAAVL